MAEFSALIEILGLYGALTLSFLGLGRAARSLFMVGEPPSDSRASDIWIGWSVALTLLQFVHLFRPLGAWEAIIVFGLGAALFLRQRGPGGLGLPRLGFSGAACAAVWMVAAVWIASRSMQTPYLADSGIYHLNAIRWLNSFRIIPGLGNLHGRLAFNCSFFTYVAALNFYPFFGHGRSVANGYLFLVLLAQILGRLRPAIEDAGALGENHGLARAGDLLALPLLAYLGLRSLDFASPSPDLASKLLQIAVFLLLVHGLGEWSAGIRSQAGRVFTLMVLAVTAITIKLSNMGFSAGILALCLAQIVHARLRPAQNPAENMGTAHLARTATKNTFLLCAFIFSIWLVRGYITSGYPLYPSTFGRIDFDWSMQPGHARFDADTVYSFAREPFVDMNQVLAGWGWLGPWISRWSKSIEGVVYPVAFSAVACALLPLASMGGAARPRHSQLMGWMVFTPILAGLAFWFLTAPDPRYANSLIWLLAIASALVLIRVSDGRFSRRGSAMMIVIVAVACNVSMMLWAASNPRSLLDVSLTGWKPEFSPNFSPRRTLSGLTVYSFRLDMPIWNGPIPATPEFNPRLALRVPGKLESGFMVK